MKHYEVLFIVKPTLTEDEIKQRVDFIKEVITKNGGEIANVVEMGARKLAYTIKKYERGVYFVIYFTAPTPLITELTRNIRYNEDIIRFLTIKYENKREIAAWEKLSKGIKLNTIKKEPRKTFKKEGKDLNKADLKDSFKEENFEEIQTEEE